MVSDTPSNGGYSAGEDLADVVENDFSHGNDRGVYTAFFDPSNGIDHFRDIASIVADRMEATEAQPKITKQSAARRQVLELIERLGVGTAIPSSGSSASTSASSRLTVRAALDDLAREGYLVRRRGGGVRAAAEDHLASSPP